ncbi:hypothetical protein N867_09405, partial [Actinotalea fermentans ATCC 43279 = JCM 9966 = DSM 3133]
MSLLAVVLGSVLGLPVAAAPTATAAVAPDPATSTTWALQPATADGPDGRISLRHVVDGGARADDLVALTNFSDRPATFAVYASDGVVTADGSFDVLASGQAPVDGGAWITVGPVDGAQARDGGGLVLELAAGATALVPVGIAVPAQATPGDHPAGVVAELVQGAGSAVQLTSRVGVRVHLRVSGDVAAALAPETVTASYTPSWNPFAPGTLTVTTTVTNAGNVRLGARTTTSLAGPAGVAPTSAADEQREVLPGTTTTSTVEVAVPPLVMAWGEVTVTPVVVGEDDLGGAALSPATASFTVWTVPWSQLALLLALVAGVLLARRARRRSAARVQARIDAAVAAATAA